MMTSSAQAPVYTQLGSGINTISSTTSTNSPYQINGFSSAALSSRELQQQQQHYGNIFTTSMLPGATMLHQMSNAFAISQSSMGADSSAPFTTVCLPIVLNHHLQHQQQIPENSGAFMNLPVHSTFPMGINTTTTTTTTTTFNDHHHHQNNHFHQASENTAEQQSQHQGTTAYDLNNSSVFQQHYQNGGGVQLIFQNVSSSPLETGNQITTAQQTPLQPATVQTMQQLISAPELLLTTLDTAKTTSSSTTPHLAVKSAPQIKPTKAGRAPFWRKHTNAKSSVQKPNICLVCRLYFADAYTLLEHNRSHHQDLFTSNRHPNSHNGNQHVQQNDKHHQQASSKAPPAATAKTPSNSESASLNQQTKHICQYCAEAAGDGDGGRNAGKSFPTASALNAHILTAHNPNKPHRCQLCEAVAFAKEKDLAVHMQRHTGVRRHLCSLCDKAFLKKSDLLRHEQVHANRRLFKCEHCARSFNDKSNLRGHIKRRHPG